ncbi:HAMP domain-containing protein [Sanguibacter inulinus]|uniref:histidine kinase n=1 Tax=Sanguibacter inulinus TaxID=60922 RepID=A0A853EV48_9MICO|nr:ATP-binding protein [Sanguibacter inulinus]MBF0723284.1 HAMP domain-containing protein [Sanguibacter inulinus]NYS94429.1 HAMP domain-containing protein [Sanguibacter inulinus]
MRRPAAAQRAGSTLRRQLGVTVASAGAVLLVILLYAVYSLLQVVHYQNRVTDIYASAISYSDGLTSRIGDIGSAVDAYLQSGVDSALGSYRTADTEAARAIRTAFLEDYGPDSEVVVALDRTLGLVATWRSQFADPAVAEVSVEGPGAVSDATVERGERLLADARDAALDLETVLETGREEASDALAAWTRNLFLAVVVLAGAAVVVAVGTWRTLRRRVLEPLADLAAKAEAVSTGELDLPVRTEGPGEIASLAHAVDAMRVELVARMASEARSRAEIAEAHEQVLEQAEELRRSNRDLEQFAYVASHDLQEPLRKVASFTQLLQKRYGGELDERADQYIEFAVDGAKRMQRLIQDLLGFSRVGRSAGEAVEVDLVEACATAVTTLDAAVEESGGQVEVGDLPVVLGQQTLLVQLFQNLVGNALKFRHPDRTPHVILGAVRREDAWELWCSDNGIGIDQQYADRVFVIFQRLHAKDAYEGTGIGLALCKKIVEFHGGEIWLDTDVSQGTTIRWTLPDPREVGSAGPEDQSQAEGADGTTPATTTAGTGDLPGPGQHDEESS